jgi:putative flippase GtrA
MIKIKNTQNVIQMIKFIIVGFLNTLIGYLSYFLFLSLNFHYVIAMGFAHVIGVTHSYFWNKYWTFKSKSKSKKEIFRFISVYLIVFILNILSLSLFVEKFHIQPAIAGLASLFFITIISFTGHKFWSFKKEEKKSN